MNDYQSLLKEIAYSYYYQGTQIQYDQLGYRRNINPKPEFATSLNTIYLDCSSYVNSIIYQAFGINITSLGKSTANYDEYAKKNQSNDDVLYYINTSDYPTETAKSDLLAKIQNELQVGDLVCYRHGASSGTSGHVMIYIGDGLFLHCTGSSYIYNDNPTLSYDKATAKEATIGGILLLDSSEVFSNTSSNRYLFHSSSSDTTWSFSVIRVLNRDGLEPTDEAKNRMSIKGLSIEKSSEPTMSLSVRIGDEITYSIELVNNTNNMISNINVSDEISSKCEYKNGSINDNGVVNDNMVLWSNIMIPANTKLTLSYTVTVKDNTEGIINSNETYVNGAKTNAIYHTINHLSEQDINDIINVSNNYYNSSSDYSSSYNMINQIYYEATGKYISSNYSTTSSIINDLINSSTKTCQINTEISEMLLPNLYGGRAIASSYTTDVNRTRYVDVKLLEVGDVIFINNSYNNTYKAYIYIGDNTLLTISNSKPLKVTITSNKYNNFLAQLIAYNKFAIIRPSLIL